MPTGHDRVTCNAQRRPGDQFESIAVELLLFSYVLDRRKTDGWLYFDKDMLCPENARRQHLCHASRHWQQDRGTCKDDDALKMNRYDFPVSAGYR